MFTFKRNKASARIEPSSINYWFILTIRSSISSILVLSCPALKSTCPLTRCKSSKMTGHPSSQPQQGQPSHQRTGPCRCYRGCLHWLDHQQTRRSHHLPCRPQRGRPCPVRTGRFRHVRLADRPFGGRRVLWWLVSQMLGVMEGMYLPVGL